jgi:hypothetical protein
MYLCFLSNTFALVYPISRSVFPVVWETFVMPLHEYMALEPHQQGIVPIVPHEAFACIFVPNTNSRKWYFAITVEPV